METPKSLQATLEANAKEESRLKSVAKTNEGLKKALAANQLGAMFLKADKCEKSVKLFQTAIRLFDGYAAETHDADCGFTNAYFNIAKALSGLKKYKEASEYLELCVTRSPFRGIKTATLPEYRAACKLTAVSHLNSFECLVEAYSDLAVNYYKTDCPQKAYENCMRALSLQPNKSETIKTLGNVLRQVLFAAFISAR